MNKAFKYLYKKYQEKKAKQEEIFSAEIRDFLANNELRREKEMAIRIADKLFDHVDAEIEQELIDTEDDIYEHFGFSKPERTNDSITSEESIQLGELYEAVLKNKLSSILLNPLKYYIAELLISYPALEQKLSYDFLYSDDEKRFIANFKNDYLAMKIKSQEIEERFNLIEEKFYTAGAVAGMLMMWQSDTTNQTFSVNESKNINNQNHIQGLPIEIGIFIGGYFNRLEAAKIVRVCKKANEIANAAKEKFIMSQNNLQLRSNSNN